MMLQWGCTYFFKMISFPLDVYKEVGLLDDTVVLFLISWETSIVFSVVAEPIYIPTKRSLSSCSGQCLSALVFLVILTDMRWYLLVVLICIFWWSVMLKTFSCICWPFVCLLGKWLFRSFAHFKKIRLFEDFLYSVNFIIKIYSQTTYSAEVTITCPITY